MTVGAAYDILDNVELVADYRWIGWDGLDTMGDQFGWENQNIVKVGVTWSVNDALVLRSGISSGNSPIDENVAFGNSLFPAIMETHWSCGASYMWNQWAAHFAYTHAMEEELTANGNDMPLNMGSGTEIGMYQNSLTAGLSYMF